MRFNSLLVLPSSFTTTTPHIKERAYGNLDEHYLLGIDGGATKTIAIVVDRKGSLLGTGYAGPSNKDAIGPTKSLEALKKAIDEALSRAKISYSDISCAVLALAGVHTTEDQRWFEQRLVGFQPRLGFYIVNDVIAAWAAGTMCEAGIAVIAGTGSNAFGVSGKGHCWRAGGWGHILGDEGSAYWIGLMGIRAALYYRDGRGPRTRLFDQILRCYNLPSIEALPQLMYGKGLTKDEIAAFASCVWEEAQNGDHMALRLFRMAGNELGLMVCSIVKKLNMQAEDFPVALTGSVFHSRSLIIEPLEKKLHRTACHAHVIMPEMPPVAGAILLTVRAAGLWDRFNTQRFRTGILRDLNQQEQ